MSEKQPNYRRLEAKRLETKAALLDAVDDLRRAVESDSDVLWRPIKRIETASRANLKAKQECGANTRLIGQRFDELVVIDFARRWGQGSNCQWLCECDCGATRIVREPKLRQGKIKHCGKCHPPYAVRYVSDLTGQRFGALVVVGVAPKEERHDPQAVWRCRCDCGGTVDARAERLNRGETQNCGCRPVHFTDLTGQRFGTLVVIAQAENDAGKTQWLCLCDCGGTVVRRRRSLIKGRTSSCPECAAHGYHPATLQTLNTARSERWAEEARRTREQTLAAGERPCNRCGAPLHSTVRPVCRRCITAAETKARNVAA